MLVVISSLQCVFMCSKLQDMLASDGYGILRSCRKAAESSDFILDRENSLDFNFINLYCIFYCCSCSFCKCKSWYYRRFETVKIGIARL